MKFEKVFLVGTHRYSCRAGIPSEIVGVAMCKPNDNLPERLCYHIKWSDGYEDWIGVDGGHYKLITFKDIINGNIPEIID